MKALTNINSLSLKKGFILFSLFYLLGCGVNEAQRDFENAALSPPAEITEMTATGVPVEGEEADESDWRIAPEFSGLVSIQTVPYPNPVHFGGTVEIHFYVSGIQAVNGLRIYVFQPNRNTLSPLYMETQPPRGLTVVSLSAAQIARSVNTTSNLYRIVIYDGLNNIVTYGDIKVVE